MRAETQALAQRYYDALNRRDAAALDAVLAHGLVHRAGSSTSDAVAFRRMLRAFDAGFPDLQREVEEILVDGAQVVVRSTIRGTHRGAFLGHSPSGRAFRAAALTLFRCEGGRVCEIHDFFDTLDMLVQLGLYAPAATTETAATAAMAAPIRANSHVVPTALPLLQTPPGAAARTSHGRTAPGPTIDFSLAQVRGDPLGFLGGLVGAYGDVVGYRCAGRQTVLLNLPDAMRHIFHDNAANYTKLDTPDLQLLKPMLGDGLLTTVGPTWQRDRAWIQRRLARRRVERFAPAMVAATHAMLARWRARAQPWAELDIVREMSRLTLEIAASTLFSSDFAARSNAFGEAMDRLNEGLGDAHPERDETRLSIAPALKLIRRSVWETLLARRFHDSGEDDLVAALLALQRRTGAADAALVDQGVTLLLAGHETTAKSLAWTLALLAEHDDARARMQAEIDAVLGPRTPDIAALAQLPWLRAAIEESQRLYPPIWLLTRSALADDVVAGWQVPAGALVAISPWLLHRHPRLWPRADRFEPERFLGPRDGAGSSYAWLPFGHGQRLCVGRFFAETEMALVLATLGATVELRPVAAGRPEPEALVTLRPRGRLAMQPLPRELAGAPGRAVQ